MRILVVHNYYQEFGGEDRVFESEVKLLRDHGHEVRIFTEHNDRVKQMAPFTFALKSIWNYEAARKIQAAIQEFKPEVAHCHNPFFLMSPSIYAELHNQNVPIVQSLHNARIMCPGARLYRQAIPCEECVGRVFPWSSLQHRCFRNSFIQTLWLSLINRNYLQQKLWPDKIQAFIVFSEYYRKIYQKWGIPKDKLFLKPHFISKKIEFQADEYIGDYVLYLGRLFSNKGLRTLLQAWKDLKNIPLVIAGEGEERVFIEKFIQEHNLPNVKLIGKIDPRDVYEYIKKSRFVVIPSEFAESFGLIAIEAFACGVPVVSSKVSSLVDIVEHQKTGLQFETGNASDLRAKVLELWHDLLISKKMGIAAREVFEQKYTAEVNYEMFMKIYDFAIRSRDITKASS